MKTYSVNLTERQLNDLKSYAISREINANNPKTTEFYGDLFARLCAAVHVSTEYEKPDSVEA